jgi:MFS family permease
MLLGLVSLMGMPYAVLMPIFADRILHGGADALGLLMGASGLGALIGALTLAARSDIHGLGRWVAYASGNFGISLVLFSLSTSFWLSVTIMFTGFAMMIEMSASNTLIQTMVPDSLRGRVMVVYSMMFMGMAPLGALLAGTLAEHIGAPLTVRIGGTVCVIGAGLFALALPKLRREARQIIVAQQMTGGSPANEMTGEAAILSNSNSSSGNHDE